jgi:hypothetical protein
LAAVDTRPVTASGASATAPQGSVTYPVSGCLSYFVDGTSEGMEMTECVTAVTVRPDGNLHLDFEWTLTVHDPAWSGIQFQSDANNRNMYLTDNRGRRLDHLGVGGEALVESALQDGDRRTGWFLFPPLEGGATSFVFHDDDHGAATTPIERVWP